MDYQATDLIIKAAQLFFTAVNFAGVIALWFAGRGRATKEAIDRVEAKNREQHAGQQERIITLETEFRHLIGKKQLEDALKPLYDMGRANEKHAAEIAKELKSVSDQQKTLTDKILERGLNK